MFDIDVLIVGGGPAGLNAALTLGRARRRVLLCDTDQGRNAAAHAVHGFLTRDGLAPAELRRIARQQLAPYPTVEVRDTWVRDVVAETDQSGFTATLADGSTTRARRVLLATGLVDQPPAIPGLAELWGTGVVHCPYCDAFEVVDQPLAVLGSDPSTIQLTLQLTRFSPDVVLCTNGPVDLDPDSQALLATHGVGVRSEPVARLEGRDGALSQIVFDQGEPLTRRALFLKPATRQRSDLPAKLGCRLLEDDSVEVDDFGRTSVPGVLAAGDLARRPAFPFPTSQVVMAAAAGAIAAVAIDKGLLAADLRPAATTAT